MFRGRSGPHRAPSVLLAAPPRTETQALDASVRGRARAWTRSLHWPEGPDLAKEGAGRNPTRQPPRPPRTKPTLRRAVRRSRLVTARRLVWGLGRRRGSAGKRVRVRTRRSKPGPAVGPAGPAASGGRPARTPELAAGSCKLELAGGRMERKPLTDQPPDRLLSRSLLPSLGLAPRSVVRISFSLISIQPSSDLPASPLVCSCLYSPSSHFGPRTTPTPKLGLSAFGLSTTHLRS